MDARALPGVDVVTEVFTLPAIKQNSVKTIYASHILEHVPRPCIMTVLARWYTVLKPKGLIRISVPDWDAIVQQYMYAADLTELLGLLYGRQDYPGNEHKCVWNYTRLCKDLMDIGFVNPRRYDWRDTEHAKYDDCSQAYIPHMEKECGRLMSLNVEATKPL
jgi:predicted SAM-dependent methyltransferase